MKIVVKFPGTTGHGLPGVNPSDEIILDLPDKAKVKDLFDHFNIPSDKKYVVIIQNKIAEPEFVLSEGMTIYLLRAVYGG